ncbi:hypothetical protein AA309_19205 [Microvirga vignae]|uniref:DUF2188 domain-containing protein n=1 Tax=Microvirga vignae TaxID=1225564 RepID=A0A0H1R8H4_9HYPH|nr:hypothetical protein [Microvirga vignae]KLK91530.1 hypothetical protein AA309_19205 [Microvirga vignae]
MKQQFVIAPIHHHWVVVASNGSRQVYGSRSQAIRMAIQAAHSAGENGDDAQVVGLDANNLHYAIWTCGQDSFTRL